MNCHSYAVYGLSVHSDIPLALPARGSTTLGAVSIAAGSTLEFDEARRATGVDASPASGVHALLADGASYVWRPGAGEFIVSSSGWNVRYRRCPEPRLESFEAHVLGEVLSLALVKRGFEPIRATVAMRDGRALALLGDRGIGKSTLASAMLQEGFRLVSDDLLVTGIMDATVFVYPGPPRLRLSAARPVLPQTVSPTSTMYCGAVVPLAAMYHLRSHDTVLREQDVAISRMTFSEAVATLVRCAFNREATGAQRVVRQLDALGSLAGRAPMKRLSSPRDLSRLPDVVRRLTADAL